MIDFAESDTHGSIMVLVVMSHGDKGGLSGKILTSTCEKIDVEMDIVRYYNT